MAEEEERHKGSLPPLKPLRLLTIEILEIELVCLHCPCKYFRENNTLLKMADLHPRQGNLLLNIFFQGSTKPLFSSQNRVEISQKNFPFFQTCFFYNVLLFNRYRTNGI
jgi:hypothetical protein